MSDFPNAHLITFHTYGSWLHGHAKGSIDREHNRFGGDFAVADRNRFAAMRKRMTQKSVDFEQLHAT